MNKTMPPNKSSAEQHHHFIKTTPCLQLKNRDVALFPSSSTVCVLKSHRDTSVLRHTASHQEYVKLSPGLAKLNHTSTYLAALKYVLRAEQLFSQILAKLESFLVKLKAFKNCKSKPFDNSLQQWDIQSISEFTCKLDKLCLFNKIFEDNFLPQRDNSRCRRCQINSTFSSSCLQILKSNYRFCHRFIPFENRADRIVENILCQCYLLSMSVVNFQDFIQQNLACNSEFCLKFTKDLHCSRFTVSVSDFFGQLAYLRAPKVQLTLFEKHISILKKKNNENHLLDTINNDSTKEIPTLKNTLYELKKCYKLVTAEETSNFTQLFEAVQAACVSNSRTNSDRVCISRNVQWSGDLGPVQREQLYCGYTDTMWSHLLNEVFMATVCACLAGDYTTIKRLCHNEQRFAEAKNILKCWKRLEPGSQPSSFMESLSHIALSLSNFETMQKHDLDLCKSMGTYLKDRYRYNQDVTPVSQNVSTCLQANSFFEQHYQLLNISVVPRKMTSYYVIEAWLTLWRFLLTSMRTKRQQFAAAGAWEQFFVASLVDIGHVTDVLTAMPENWSRENENVKNCIDNFKSFEGESLDLFEKTIKQRSTNAWQQHMPSGKVWKRRGTNQTANQASGYIKVVAELILGQLIEPLQCLGKDTALEILCRAVDSFMKSWIEFILAHRIKFSWFGSQQLMLDFQYMMQWFEQDRLRNEDLSQLHSLLVFNEMNKGLLLLSCQPSGRNKSDDLVHSSSLISSASTISEVSIETYIGNQFDEVISSVEIPHKEIWLSLRVKGGNSSKNFLCIKKNDN